MQTDVNYDNWDIYIHAKPTWFTLHLHELWRYRDLILLFVHRDFVSLYKQTILGPLWFVIQPVLTTIMFTFIFGKVANISTDGIPPPLFYMAGIVLWNYFSACFNKTSTTFTANAAIFGKVYFPRMVMPISIIISSLFSFALQFILFLFFLLYYGARGTEIHPHLHILLIPYLVLLMACIGLGGGIIISSLTTKYKDLTFLITFGVQLLMYATPIIYPISAFPEKYRVFILANPLSPIIESFKYALLGAGTFSWQHLAYSTTFAIILLLIGLLVFNRTEKQFMDVI